MLAAPEFIPNFPFKALDWSAVPSVAEFIPRESPGFNSETMAERGRAEARAATLRDPRRSMDRFYEALHRTESRDSGALTRILHSGDSPTTADLITADVRALLQKHFGSGGMDST